MPGINEIYRYIDLIIAEQRRSFIQKQPSGKLLPMLIELKTKIHVLRCNDCQETVDQKFNKEVING